MGRKGSKIKFSANCAGLLPHFAPFLTNIQTWIILNNALQGTKRGVVQADRELWYTIKNVPHRPYPAPSFAPERERYRRRCNQRKSLKNSEMTMLQGANRLRKILLPSCTLDIAIYCADLG